MLPGGGNRAVVTGRMLAAFKGFCGARCPVCGAGASGSGFFCLRCRDGLRMRTTGYCPACGELYELSAEEPYLCRSCRQKRPPWASFAFFGAYSGLLRDLLLRFKFGPDYGCCAALGYLLYEAYLARCPTAPDLIAAVPLQGDRLKRRGFNQSLELAVQLGRRTKIRVERSALEKQRSTSEQSALPRKERLSNLAGAFVVRKDKVRGKNVLLVDDVATTGATLAACSKELIAGKAARVDVICLARAS